MTKGFAYRLILDPRLSDFAPEIEYAFGFVDESYGLVRTETAERIVHYGIDDAREGALFIPAKLFDGSIRIDEQGIWPEKAELAQWDDPAAGLLPIGNSCGDYDAIGLIFHQLSRFEERDATGTDAYGRFRYADTLAGRLSLYGAALADRAAQDIASAITGEPNPVPQGSYSVMPTHDVDQLRGYHRFHEPLRYAAGDILKRRNFPRGLERLRLAYFSGLPFSSLIEMMDLSERYGLRSEFYYIGPSSYPEDAPYGLLMPDLVKRTADAVSARGHILGYHPGHATYNDAQAWTSQKLALENQIGALTTRGRQHRLEYDFAETPDIWNAAGMELDCTPAFPEASGFRTGTCRPHRAYSLRHREPLNLRLLSTPVQDFAFFSGGKYRDLSLDAALEEASGMVETCKRFNGTLCVLQHLGQVSEPVRTFYHRFLALACDDQKSAV